MSEPCRILIVEDEMVIALDLSDTLLNRGYSIVDTVPSGEEALRLCAVERPDVVLMDIRLQGELSGLQTAQLLRERYDIPSIVLTAFFDDAMLREAQAAKVLAYLIKPYDERELCATLATALLRHREERELRREIAGREVREPAPPGLSCSDSTLKIHTFAPALELSLGNTVLSGEDLTRTQRSILGLILATPRYRIDRNDLEAELWPDTSLAKTRSNLDSALMRLRRLLEVKFATGNVKDCLLTQHGVVALEGCMVDLDLFEQGSKQGRLLRRNGDIAGGAAALESACGVWRGEFLGGIPPFEQVEVVRRYTTRLFLENCHLLAELYSQSGRLSEALVILSRALAIDQTSELTATQLYIAYQRNGMATSAIQLLQSFKAQLIRNGVHPVMAIDAIKKIERSGELALQQRR